MALSYYMKKGAVSLKCGGLNYVEIAKSPVCQQVQIAKTDCLSTRKIRFYRSSAPKLTSFGQRRGAHNGSFSL